MIKHNPKHQGSLTNVRSASSLHLDLREKTNRNLAGEYANTNAQPNHYSKKSLLLGVSTKGKFHDHVKLDDDRIRERDNEAFKRNNPRAYELIQRQREMSDQRAL